ncbi:AAA family ATPase [Priestia aryabhattai]|uniref:AAA family ATPase n=1 Tax=Priestia aryabhattai TaxID=412384 RepID=UPI0039A0034B
MTMLAPSKFGKTTLAVDLAREFYDGDMSKMLLLATEIGYKTMNGVFAIPITGFDYAEEEDGEQKGFIETVDELIENKADIPFRFIVIDTITALERYAVSYALKKKGREDGKRYTDISDILWGAGYSLVAEAIYHQIDRLKKAGFGVFIIGHSKTKKIKNKDGFEYDYTTLNVLGKTSDIIEREADIIIFGDMQVTKGADGEIKTERLLRFRSDGNILCGARFRNFPDVIESDAGVFLKTFKDAVLGLYDNDEDAVEEAKKEQEAEREAKAEKAIENEVSAESYHEEIGLIIKGFEKTTKQKVAKKFKELFNGDANFLNSTDKGALKEALEFVKGLA